MVSSALRNSINILVLSCIIVSVGVDEYSAVVNEASVGDVPPMLPLVPAVASIDENNTLGDVICSKVVNVVERGYGAVEKVLASGVGGFGVGIGVGGLGVGIGVGGAGVGIGVGNGVGKGVGCGVGDGVGFGVGIGVGFGVGAGVGDPVGAPGPYVYINELENNTPPFRVTLTSTDALGGPGGDVTVYETTISQQKHKRRKPKTSKSKILKINN